MKYYATIDADGRRTATYLPSHPNIPEDAFEIDEATFREWIENDRTRRWDHTKGALVKADPPSKPAPPTAGERAAGRMAKDPVLSALVAVVAEKLGSTPQTLIGAIKAEIEKA